MWEWMLRRILLTAADTNFILVNNSWLPVMLGYIYIISSWTLMYKSMSKLLLVTMANIKDYWIVIHSIHFKLEKTLSFKSRIGYVFFQYAVMTLCHSFLELKFCPCCLIYVLANELNFNDSNLESPYFASLHKRRQLILFQPAVA